MNTLRPDERAALAETERNQRFENRLQSGAKTIGSAALTAVGAGLSARILPLLSEHVPLDLAVKGISKISPKLGDFLKRGSEHGLDLKEGLDFIKEKLEPALENKINNSKKRPQQINEIGKFNPDLQSFIEDQIQAGKAPDHAAALAMNQAEFLDLVKGIERKINKPFTKFVREIYEGKAVQQEQPQQAPPQQAPQMPQQSAQQPGQGNAALMAILQKIQQSKGQP